MRTSNIPVALFLTSPTCNWVIIDARINRKPHDDVVSFAGMCSTNHRRKYSSGLCHVVFVVLTKLLSHHFFSEKSLRKAVKEYLAYYHHDRNNQGLDNQIIAPDENVGRVAGKIKCRERLGGLLKHYYRDAA